VVDEALDVRGDAAGLVVGDVAARDREGRDALLRDLGVADGTGVTFSAVSASTKPASSVTSVCLPVSASILATGSGAAAAWAGCSESAAVAVPSSSPPQAARPRERVAAPRAVRYRKFMSVPA
jgi:hypothetical protein